MHSLIWPICLLRGMSATYAREVCAKPQSSPPQMGALEYELFGQLNATSSEPPRKGTKRARKAVAAADGGPPADGTAALDPFGGPPSDPANSREPHSQGAARGEPAKAPAWRDEGDDGLEVDLKAVPGLRKLRASADERHVDGAVYEERLRALHRKLHPRTTWANTRSTHVAGAGEGPAGEQVGYVLGWLGMGPPAPPRVQPRAAARTHRATAAAKLPWRALHGSRLFGAVPALYGAPRCR